ncbi:CLUMA_CG003347, isoform A [Clunio marinus]|uniref:CLUMA_CG003347, isoform A n=1 Tax=Clunio marinus TaxID=568069 RepID=A0A1J1HQ21_9DIPT|nr:CLUMA_CG003347, isoform A [Clunio marinus]
MEISYSNIKFLLFRPIRGFNDGGTAVRVIYNRKSRNAISDHASTNGIPLHLENKFNINAQMIKINSVMHEFDSLYYNK